MRPGLIQAGLQSVWKKFLVGRRRQTLNEIAIHQSVQILADHHDSPRRNDFAIDRGRMRKPLGFCFAEAKLEGPSDRLRVPESFSNDAILSACNAMPA